MNKWLASFLLLIGALGAAWAGSSTILYQSAGTIPFAITTDAGGNAISRQTVWDYSSAANGVAVDAGHSMQVAGEGVAGTPAGGVISVQGVSGGTGMVVSQPTAANLNATEANSAAILSAVQAAVQPGTAVIGNVGVVPYPTGATPETASATGTTGATVATLATAGGITTYICGFSIRANANAALTGNATVAGTITGTLNFTQWVAVNTSGLGVTEMVFQPCVPASGTNTTIVVTSVAASTGGVTSVSAWGFTK